MLRIKTLHEIEEEYTKDFFDMFLNEADNADADQIKQVIKSKVDVIEDSNSLNQILDTVIMVSGLEISIKDLLTNRFEEKMGTKSAKSLVEFFVNIICSKRNVHIDEKKRFFEFYSNQKLLISFKKLQDRGNIYDAVGENIKSNALFQSIAPYIMSLQSKEAVSTSANIGPGELFMIIFSSDMKKGTSGDIETKNGTKVELKGNNGRLYGLHSVVPMAVFDSVKLIFKTELAKSKYSKKAINMLPASRLNWNFWTSSSVDIQDIFSTAGLSTDNLKSCFVQMYTILFPGIDNKTIQIAASKSVKSKNDMILEIAKLQFIRYKKEDGWDRLMVIDKLSGDYCIMSNVEDFEDAILSGYIRIIPNMSFKDKMSAAFSVKIAKQK
jgi:hypothetical protein